MTEQYYTPGTCNLNEEEVDYRTKAGYIFAVIGVVHTVALIAFMVTPLFGVTAFVPIWLAALQYLQVKNRFCATYALRGIYSSGNERGQTSKVIDRMGMQQDRTRAVWLHTRAVLVGVAYTIPVVIMLAYL